MTTLRDLLNDLLHDAEVRMQSFADKDKYPVLTQEDKTELLNEYTLTIKERIIG